MIWHPAKGQRVRLHYKASKHHFHPYNGRVGTVAKVGKGPGPIAALVAFENGDKAIVPRGNLVEVKA